MLFFHDLFVLSSPFIQEIRQLFPLPCEVDFATLTKAGELLPFSGSPKPESFESAASHLPAAKLINDQLALPLQLAQPVPAVAAIRGVDPAFLRKMSPEWLGELQTAIQTNLEKVKSWYLDPATDLYNRRALHTFSQRPSPEPYRFRFIVRVVFTRSNAVRLLQKHTEIARLLFSLTEGVCFSFGQGIFGILSTCATREQALHYVHVLQRRLKREGVRQAPVAFSSRFLLTDPSSVPAEESLWAALTAAEKRGPFGLCDADTIGHWRTNPFVPANSSAIMICQKKWRDLDRFTLVMLRAHNPNSPGQPFAPELKNLLGSQSVCIEECEGGVLVLLPYVEQHRVHSAVQKITRHYASAFAAGAISLGIASWPLLDFSRKSTPGNCLKALMHAELLGRGSVVDFDHLSLNVSGDHSFEEGDYRSAIREYHRGLRLAPDDVNLLNSLGVSLVECRQMAKAAACFECALDKEPRNVMALVNLGYLKQVQGNQSAALAYLEQAYQVDDDENQEGQDFLLTLARLYTELGYHAKAIGVLTRWQTLPGSGNEYLLYRLLGQNYYEEGQPAQAMVACQKALQLYPHDSTAMSFLGLLYAEQGEGASLAESLCKKALEIDGFNADHWWRLGQVLHLNRNQAAALEAAQQGLALQRHHAGCQLLRGKIYQALDRPQRAERCFRRVMTQAKASASLKTQARKLLAAHDVAP